LDEIKKICEPHRYGTGWKLFLWLYFIKKSGNALMGVPQPFF
jgi:hypothetical protein